MDQALGIKMIEHYLAKKDYFIRIRKEKETWNTKVYYNGIQVLEVENQQLFLNEAMFFLKGTHDQFKEVDSSSIQKLEKLGFSFTCGFKGRGPRKHTYYLTVEPSSNQELYNANKKEIQEKMNQFLEALKKVKKDATMDEEKNTYYFTFSDPRTSYEDLIFLQKLGINLTVPQEGITKIQMNEKIVWENQKITEKFFETVEELMEQRIQEYNGGTEEYGEKQFQQKLMNLMFEETSKKELRTQKDFPFSKSEPFEMEYYLYEDDRETRKQNSRKGRVDNIFIEKNKIQFTELKIDDNVIGGKNGIHKHLIDILNGLKQNKEAMEEIEDYVKDYNEALSMIPEKQKYQIPIEELKEREFVIVCGYNKNQKENVQNKIKEIWNKTAKEVGVEEKDYKEDYLSMNVPTLIEELKKVKCEVKIYLTKEDYHCFELYKN